MRGAFGFGGGNVLKQRIDWLASKLGAGLRFRRTTTDDEIRLLLRSTPGPSPWFYSDKFGIIPGHHWTGSKGGCVILARDSSQIILVLGYYHYVLALDDEHILVWVQKGSEEETTAPVEFRLIDLSQLKPIGEDVESLSESCQAADGFLSEGPLQEHFHVPTHLNWEQESLEIPHLDVLPSQLTIVCQSSLIASPTSHAPNHALIDIDFENARSKAYPQDWFNNGDFDFGYDWITHVVRVENTGRTFGFGIRLGAFELDKTRTKLKRWINSSKFGDFPFAFNHRSLRS